LAVVTIAQAAAHVAQIGRQLDDVTWRATNRAARYGKTLIVEEAVDMFGSDRRPSRWKRGRKTVNARYRIRRDHGAVSGVLYPTGDPFYTFTAGRRPGVYRTRLGNPKRYPAMAARPEHWHRVSRLFVARFPEIVHTETTVMLAKIYGRG
jgi:hypothetical protein